MNCRTFQRRLQSLLDDRLPFEVDPELEQHVWKCDQCQQLMDAQQRMWMLLASEPPPASPVDLAERVLANLPQAAPHTPYTTPITTRWKWLAIAASLLLLLSPIALRWRQRPIPNVNSSVQHPPTPAAPDSSQFADKNGAQPSFNVSQQDYERVLVTLAAQIQQVRNDPLESVDGITGRLRPITASFSATIDALRKTFPLPSKDGTTKPQADARHTDVYA